MRTTYLRACVSIVTLGFGLLLAAPPVMAENGGGHGGGAFIGRHGGGGGARHGNRGGFGGGGGAWHGNRGGGYGGGGGGHRDGYGYGGAALGLGLLGGAIIGSQYPYNDSGYSYEDGNSSAYCASRFRSYDPASGTYLGYDGLRHPCP